MHLTTISYTMEAGLIVLNKHIPTKKIYQKSIDGALSYVSAKLGRLARASSLGKTRGAVANQLKLAI